MAHYAVGDIQGCFDELIDVLEQAKFNPQHDKLWVVGDMINRGPKSLETLRFLYNNRHAVNAVLGNHDLHFLAVLHNQNYARPSDTFTELLNAQDISTLAEWLRHLPLCYYDSTQNYCMAHAGIAPQWTLEQALSLSKEVEACLQSSNMPTYLRTMYGNEPSIWHNDLQGYERLRCITNYFTRMRACSLSGQLDLGYKWGLDNLPKGYYPWFQHPERKTQTTRILFGHWASLNGHIGLDYVYGLDTACVWGKHLTLLNLDTQQCFTSKALLVNECRGENR